MIDDKGLNPCAARAWKFMSPNLGYNNNQVPSIARLGLNVFENSLHSSKTTSKMLLQETFKIVCYMVVWIVCMLNRNTSLDLIAVISQTLLTTTIIANYIKLIILKMGFEHTLKNVEHYF